MCRAALELNLKHTLSELSSLHETKAVEQRQKDVELRQLKKANQRLAIATDGLQQAEKLFEEKKANVRKSFGWLA